MTPVANRIIVEMLPEEKAVLRALVDSDVRTPRDTFRWLLVEEGRRRGWLTGPEPPEPRKHNGAELHQASGAVAGR